MTSIALVQKEGKLNRQTTKELAGRKRWPAACVAASTAALD